MRSVRIWFSKFSRAKYISHLDLMRFMSRAVRRAGIPLWYTEGFNPHPYMTFALPLSLGTESKCESMDIRIEGEMSNDEIMKRLSESMPEGIEITAVTEPQMKPAEIALGEYEIEFFCDNPKDFSASLNDILSGDELIVKKMGKSGRKKVEKEINLLENIDSFSCTFTDKSAVLTIVLPAGNTVNINPSLLCTAEKIESLGAESYTILRKRLMTADKKDFA